MKKAGPLPIQIVMIATALALALIISLGVFVWTSIGAVKHLQVQTVRMQELTAELNALSDGVRSVARLAVAEPDDGLRKRYYELAARRASAVQEMRQFDRSEAVERLRARAEDASHRMAESEARALSAAAGGEPDRAKAILTSPEYQQDADTLGDVSAQMSSLLHRSAEEDLESQEKLGRLVILSVAVAISLLLFTWIASLRISGNLVARRQREEAERAESDRMAAFLAEVRETIAKGDTLAGVADALIRHLQVSGAQVWVGREGKFENQCSAGGLQITGAREKCPEWIRKLAARKEPVIVLGRAAVKEVTPLPLNAFAAFPLTIGDKAVGLICLAKDSPFSELEIRAVQSVMDLIAHGIERANAEALTRQYARDLEQANARLEEQANKLARTAEELALARDAALESANLKSQFLASVSHEIRTPMTGIIGMTDLTLDTPLNEEQLEYVRLIKSSAHSLLTLLNGILDFSKIESGTIDLEEIDFEFREVLYDALKPFTQRALEKRLILRSRVAPEVPKTLIGDPNRLRQVLLNLIANAIKFTEQGEVSVEALVERTEAGIVYLQVSVADTGIGIPRDKRAIIFQPFTQADGSTTRKYGGTGLGLAICQQLLRRMGGRIWVEGEPGVGSTFTFVVPFATDAAAKHVEPLPPLTDHIPVAVPEADRYHILMAEDNHVSTMLMTRLLEKHGHTVVAVSNGHEAMQALERERFDAVLMDLQMPKLGGLEATAAIRAKEQLGTYPSGRHIPIIATTASAMKGDRERCLEAGMDGYVSKPIQRQDLLETIQNLVRKQHDTRTAAGLR